MPESPQLRTLHAPAPEQRGWWGAVREAMKGAERDYTEGSLGRAITVLSIPMILEMSMESVFAVVDVFFVARLGAEAVAAVGLTEAILTVVYSVAMGVSMATTAMVARRVGEKSPRGAAVAAAQAIWIGLAASALTGAVGILYSKRLLAVMGASAGLIRSSSGYTTVMLATSASIYLLFLMNAIFRGAGDAALAMWSVWLANLINIVLDPCLILGLGPFPRMGVTGAAVATAIGRGLGVLFQIWMLAGGRSRIRLRPGRLRIDGAVLLRLSRVSLTGMLQFLVGTASWLALVRITAQFGNAALAGYTIALRIIFFAILPAWGMSNAAATLVGQNLGAGKPERAERSVWTTAFYNMLFLAGVAVLFTLLAEPMVRLFTADGAVIPYGVACLRLVSYGYPFYAYGMVVVQAFNGAGDTVTPTIINLFCYWLLQVPLAFALALGLDLGPQGVFLAITIAESILAIVGVLVFRRGRWKAQRI